MNIQPGPVLVINKNAQRTTGNRAQQSNIEAACAMSNVIRTCLGPRAMLKMLIDQMGSIVVTSDGNAILRELDVAHPAAKAMMELCRTQDEEVGDGTTSVVILTGELLAAASPLLERRIHPTVIITAYRKALEAGLSALEKCSQPVDVDSPDGLRKIVRVTLGTKSSLGDLKTIDRLVDMAITAVKTVCIKKEQSKGQPAVRPEIDIKRYVRVEKIPGGEASDSYVLDGIMFNKDIMHPGMRKRIENPRILLLDCPLEYKKGESQTALEVTREGDFARFLQLEEEQVAEQCKALIALKPDVVVTEKGISDLALHLLCRANITCLRRLKKTDNNRLARAVGATIVNRVEDARESDIGTGCGLFRLDKIDSEYFCFFDKCKSPKACTVVLRGASKDIVNEAERCLQDAMAVARNVMLDTRIVPGAGAVEMEAAARIADVAKTTDGLIKYGLLAASQALEIVPRTLLMNCGADPISVITELRAKHAQSTADSAFFGVDGARGGSGGVVDVRQTDVFEPLVVKTQTLKTAIEAACMLLRVDDIVAGVGKSGKEETQAEGGQHEHDDSCEH